MIRHTLLRLTVAAALIAGATAASSRTAADFFKAAPGPTLPLFDNTMRLIMLEYHAAGATTKTENTLQGNSSISAMSDDMLRIAVSDSSSIDIAVVPLRGDTAIAVIETVLTPIADSDITFYTKDWQPLAYPDMPGARDFAPRGKLPKGSLPPFLFVSAEYIPEQRAFRFTDNTADNYLPTEVPEALSALQKEIILTFNGKKFTKSK